MPKAGLELLGGSETPIVRGVQSDQSGCSWVSESPETCVKTKAPDRVWWYTPVNPAPQMTEAGGSQVPVQPGQLSESLSQNKTKKTQ